MIKIAGRDISYALDERLKELLKTYADTNTQKPTGNRPLQ